jgi:hypothetical protein
VAEVIQRFKDFVQDFSGGLIRIIHKPHLP